MGTNEANNPAPSFFGATLSELAQPLTLPRCPVCEFTRMLAADRQVGMCDGCADERGITRCPDCGDPTHASESDDDGRCVPCMRAAGIAVLDERDELLQDEALEPNEDDRGPDPDEHDPRAHGVSAWGGW